MYIKTFLLLSILCFSLSTSACAGQQVVETSPATVNPIQTSDSVTITGWFATIWNGEPHYSITDDKGQTTQLLVSEEVASSLGGPLALDRKRVTVSGEIVNDPEGALRVLSIRFEEEQ
jgi:hypothetical protein